MRSKRRNSTIDQKWEDNHLNNEQFSRYAKTVIIFQQHVVFNIEINGSVQIPENLDHH